jgi:lycopene beta-cyclase
VTKKSRKVLSDNISNINSTSEQYDYIITGAGCAGLSLLMRLLNTPQQQQKKILVLDRSDKTENDRTWCFWEKEAGLFDAIVTHRWQHAHFYADTFSKELDLSPYTYKMILGVDFYHHVINYAKQFSNVAFRLENVLSVATENKKAIVVTDQQTYVADYIFNSILFDPFNQIKDEYFLWQHFKGWMIETSRPVFDASSATFMDFTVDQQRGTTFMYVLPVSATKALVEYTLFTKNVLPEAEYNDALKAYISTKLNIQEYSIVHEEFAKIPMTNFAFKKEEGRVINIGVAGGDTKASSGYTFQFIQKRTQKIVDSLCQQHHPFVTETFNEKKHRFYDTVLLHVLSHNKLKGDKIFAAIFSKNKAERVLRFLDNETNFADDVRIMQAVPTSVFLPAALREMFFNVLKFVR